MFSQDIKGKDVQLGYDGSSDGTKDSIVNIVVDARNKGWLWNSIYTGETKQDSDDMVKNMKQATNEIKAVGMFMLCFVVLILD